MQNRQQPKLEILFEIAEILDIKPKDLLNDEPRANEALKTVSKNIKNRK